MSLKKIREFGRERDFRECERCRNEKEAEGTCRRKKRKKKKKEMEVGELERK